MVAVIVAILITPADVMAPMPVTQTLDLVAQNRPKIISRSVEMRIERRVMIVTAYTSGFESTGKTPSDQSYGQTAISTPSRPVYAKEWYTVAAPPEIPTGTKIYIPFFEDKPNKGVFVVEDRGGKIKGDRLDVYFGDPVVDGTAVARALGFGVRELDVLIRK